MPKIVDHDEVRLKLAAATQRVIARVGAHGATLRAVAKEAGVSPALPMHYFDSVEEIVAFAFTTGANEEVAALHALVTQGGRDAAARLSALIHHLVGDGSKAQNEQMLQLLHFMAYSHERADLSALHAQWYERCLDLIAPLIAEHLAERPRTQSEPLASPRVEASILLAMSDGCGLQRLSSERNAQARQRACADLLRQRYGLTSADAADPGTASRSSATRRPSAKGRAPRKPS
ncbi:MAG: TetR/AcrR family transcriptional regulator [Pseudomonadota bacterium]